MKVNNLGEREIDFVRETRRMDYTKDSPTIDLLLKVNKLLGNKNVSNSEASSCFYIVDLMVCVCALCINQSSNFSNQAGIMH